MQHTALVPGSRYYVPLWFSNGLWNGPRVACLRDLTGHEERTVASTSTADALRLIDALLVGVQPDPVERATDARSDTEHAIVSDDIQKSQRMATPDRRLGASDLSASDRDRILAAIYQRAFGDKIENTLTCAECDQPFDLDFSIEELTRSLYDRSAANYSILDNGEIETPEGARLRLPTGSDEVALEGHPLEHATTTLFDRSVISSTAMAASAIETLLKEIAPLMQIDLAASCPECGHAHTAEFDIQNYLLGAILATQGQLFASIHLLASVYHWSLSEILSLTRRERRGFVELIEEASPRESAYGGGFTL